MKLKFERVKLSETGFCADTLDPFVIIDKEKELQADTWCQWSRDNSLLLVELSSPLYSRLDGGPFYALLMIKSDPVLICYDSSNTVSYQKTEFTEKYGTASIESIILTTLNSCHATKYRFSENCLNIIVDPLLKLKEFEQSKATYFKESLISSWYRLKIRKPKIAQCLKSPLPYLFIGLWLMTNYLFAAIIIGISTIGAMILYKLNDADLIVRFLLGMDKKYNYTGTLANIALSAMRSVSPVPCTHAMRVKISFDSNTRQSTIVLINQGRSIIRSLSCNKKQLLKVSSLMQENFVGQGASHFCYKQRDTPLLDGAIEIDRLGIKQEITVISSFKSFFIPQAGIVVLDMKIGCFDFKPKKYKVFIYVEHI